MSQESIGVPAAGWYTDPSAAEAYRWWNGRQWTTATLPQKPSAPAGSPSAEENASIRRDPAQQPRKLSPDTASASTGASASASSSSSSSSSLPSRRSLRIQLARDAVLAEGRALAEPKRPSTPDDRPDDRPESTDARSSGSAPDPLVEAAPPGVRAEAAVAASPRQASAEPPARDEPVILPPVAAARTAALSAAPQSRKGSAAPATPTAYRPVNPLTGPASRSGPVSPPGFTVPAAWVANAPAVPPTPGYAVHPGQFGSAVFAGPGSSGGTRPQPVNRAARLSLIFPLLVLSGGIVFGLLSGILLATRTVRLDHPGVLIVVAALFGLAAVGLVVAGIPLAIVGLVRAAGFRREGFAAKGRPQAIIGLVLCVLMLANGVHSGIVNADAQRHRAPGVSSSAQEAAPVAAAVPQVAVGQGDGSYSYSQGQAQESIGAAYTASLKSAPRSVACPASEPLQISVSFACTVTLGGGAVTTARVTIIDAEGHAEVQVE